MTDREIFVDNLNYYLKKNGIMQKDLAQAIGAKYTTVSGWTRGISYPRADAMEKIANFFGVPTSRLVGSRDGPGADDESVPKIVVPDSKRFVKLVHYMPYEDYVMVMQAFERAEKRLKEEEEKNGEVQT